jgi:hypothetical protein
MTGQDGVGAVELFKGDNEGELVLEGERAEGPEEVGGVEQGLIVSVRPADDQRDALGG